MNITPSSSTTYSAGSSSNAPRLYPPNGSYATSYQSSNGASNPPTIPSSVQAGLYEKRQRELQSHQGSSTYPGQTHSRHSEQLNYRYDDSPGVPLSQRQQQDQRHQMQQHQPRQQHQQEQQHPQQQHPQQQQEQQQRRPKQNPQAQQQEQQHHPHRPQQPQMPPTPPGSFPNDRQNHADTSQRSSGYPSPIEKQQPRRASGSNTAPLQGLPPPLLPVHPLYPMQRPSQDSMPPPPLPQPLVPHGVQPLFSQPQPPHSSLAPVPVSAPAPSPTFNGTFDPLVLSASDAALAPMALGLQSLWKDHTLSIRMAMEKMHRDFVLHLSKERKINSELSLKADELSQRLRVASIDSDASARAVQGFSSKLREAEREIQELRQRQDELRRQNDNLERANESLTRENSGLKFELGMIKETLHHASRFMTAFSDEYQKAKLNTDNTGLIIDKTGLKSNIVANLTNQGHVNTAAAVLNAVGNDPPQDVPTPMSRSDRDKQVVVRFMNSMMGAVQEHLSKKMDGKVAAILDVFMEEQSKRKAAEKALEEVLQSSNSGHSNSPLESTHNQVAPQSRAASPDPTQTTNLNRNQHRSHSQSLPPPPIQRSASVDSRLPTLSVDTHTRTYAHHRSNSFPQAHAPSHQTLPQPPPEEHRQRNGRLTSLVSSTSTHVGHEAESDPKTDLTVVRAESDQAETPNLNSNSTLPTPPPSRSKDNTFGNEDSDGDESMDRRAGAGVRETHMAGFSSDPQQEERRVPFCSSPLNKASAKQEQVPASRSPPEVFEQTSHTSESQTPSQSPHLGKRSREEYEADNVAREEERERESSPVRMKLEPEVEEEEGRRSLSNKSNSRSSESVVSGPSRYSSTASGSASAFAPTMSMSRSMSGSSGREEGEVTPAPNFGKKKRSRPGVEEEGEVVEETPPPTPMSPPPILPTGFRSRLHSQPIPQTSFQPPSRRPSQDQPPAPPAPPSAKPPAKLGINHLDLLYADDGTSYTCRMCQTRRQQEFNKGRGNKPVHVKKFPSDAAWDDLVAHCYEEHPKACGELEKLSPSQLAERKQRMLARAGPKR